jgi:hypothetical protein
MKKLVYKISPLKPSIETGVDAHYIMEFITDNTPEWTETQYLRHRRNLTMELISNETTEEK